MLAHNRTELIYHYFDLPEHQKSTFLERLTRTSPELAQQIMPFLTLKDDDASALTELLSQHVTQVVQHQDTLTDLSGQKLGKYELSHLIGSGGFGVVYEATRQDQTFDQTLAIKVTRPKLQPLLGDSFIYQEAQILARLNHPYIAKVYDGGRHDDFSYIVMEKVNGEPLSTYLQKQHLEFDEKLNLFHQICQAVHHAHQSQVLHGDIKPENIMVQAENQPKLLDFNGTAAFSEQKNIRAFSREFASPEQLSGEFLTNHSDIYSLGKLLEWLMNGEKASTYLKKIITKATQISLNERYATVQSLSEDIQALVTKHPTSFEQRTLSRVMLRASQRHPIRALFALLTLTLVLVFTHTLNQKNRQLHHEKAVTEQMIFEVTHLFFNSKGLVPLPSLLELTRRRVLANPEMSAELKQKLIQAMMTPLPEKQQLNTDCLPDCS